MKYESKIVRRLIDQFNNLNVSYCHWKSNDKLNESFNGTSDVDILIHKNDFENVSNILRKLGFTKYVSPLFKRVSSIYDFITVDHILNKIIHIHLHTELITGFNGYKIYRLNFEEIILKERVFNQEYHIYIPKPEHELEILLYRLGIKYRSEENWTINNPGRELKSLINEFNFIVNSNNISSLNLDNDIKKIVHSNLFTNKNLFDDSIKLLKILANKYRLKNYYYSQYLIGKKYILFQLSRITRKVTFSPVNRINPNNGFVIAFVGTDGTGKSTQLSIIKSILEKKIDVKEFYLGSNKGKKSLVTNYLHKYIKKTDDSLKDKNIIDRIVNLLYALSVAVDKKYKIYQINKLRDRGYFVICDRYPQNQYPGINDGPLLSKKYGANNNILYRFIAYIESSLYNIKLSKGADIVFKFIGNEETLSKRREMNIEDFKYKQNIIKCLDLKSAKKTIEIDADKSIDEISSSIINYIHEYYFSYDN